MKIKSNILFIGIGGIGMSALAKYYIHKKINVYGYDLTSSPITIQLESIGCKIVYNDNIDFIIDQNLNNENTTFVFTPAVPQNNQLIKYILEHKYPLFKRSDMLHDIINNYKVIAVAGTHGKTTTSTLMTSIIMNSKLKSNAFLGGISNDLNSNLMLSEDAEYCVVEADEFDRSFLKINPYIAIVTSTDTDHMDIYKDEEDFINTFQKFVSQIDTKGYLINHTKAKVEFNNQKLYSIAQNGDVWAENIKMYNNYNTFDYCSKDVNINNIHLNMSGIHNIENTLACITVALILNIEESTIRKALKEFRGINRRFEYIIQNDKIIYIDDYAHHPTEIKNLLHSVNIMYPHKKTLAIFQPHLFSRTRDFLEGYIQELSNVNELILLDIYPARELPIEGVNSKLLLDNIKLEKKKLMSKPEMIDYMEHIDADIIISIGAGDIGLLTGKIKEKLLINIEKR